MNKSFESAANEFFLEMKDKHLGPNQPEDNRVAVQNLRRAIIDYLEEARSVGKGMDAEITSLETQCSAAAGDAKNALAAIEDIRGKMKAMEESINSMQASITSLANSVESLKHVKPWDGPAPVAEPKPPVIYVPYDLEGKNSKGVAIALKLSTTFLTKRKGSLALGSSTRATDLTFDDPSVASVHAILKYEDNILSLEDKGSDKGTWVGGNRLKPNAPWPVALHETVRLGKLEFRLKPAK